MKANELMIGDWVCYEGDIEYECPIKVDGLCDDDISLDGEGFMGGIEGIIVPIPLTEDILKANGFIHDKATASDWLQVGEYWVRIIADIGLIEVSYQKYGGTLKAKIVVAKIKYVHELQHALRLCGLKELADNFKIKAMEG